MSRFADSPKIRAAVITAIFAVAALLFLRDIRPPAWQGPFDLDRMARIPVQEGGRIKPIDTIARSTLMMISGKQSYRDVEGVRRDAMEWFAELVLDPRASAQRRVFRIDHPDLVGLLGFHSDQRKYFSMAEIAPHFASLQEQLQRVPEESRLRTPFEKALVNLHNSLGVHDRASFMLLAPPVFGQPAETYSMAQRVWRDAAESEPGTETHETIGNAVRLFANQFGQLADRANAQAVPPQPGEPGEAWRSLGDSLLATLDNGEIDPVVSGWAELADAYRDRDVERFDALLAELAGAYSDRADSRADKTGFEYFFNTFAPFYYAMELYVLIFIVAAFSWMGWARPLAKTAFWLLVIAFTVHTFGMAARIYIQARPPVTNLYSSAIFVSWAAVPLCLYLERRALNGIAAAAAALMGFATLIIAHYLSFSGDTLEMMRAVLDSNFWLATHVPTVTLGYSATFLAGLVAILYIVRERLFGGVDEETSKVAGGMVYGAVCFALLFSFVGTVLGGIWADQSWGRFWGWDPKENGALMIVLWNWPSSAISSPRGHGSAPTCSASACIPTGSWTPRSSG